MANGGSATSLRAIPADEAARGMVPENEAGMVSAAVREKAEVEAAIITAKKWRRDEVYAGAKILKSCERPAFAESCMYRFPRGGQSIEGPSVDLAREMARCWGNLRYGVKIVSQDGDWIHIKGFCLDLETNAYVEAEDKFKNLIQRKNKVTGNTEWVRADERDLRELINRRGAFCERNAILKSMPPDIIDDAQTKARETMKRAASGEIKQDRAKTIRSLAAAFSSVGVSAEMMRAHLGHDLDILDEAEVVALRQIYKSISDGQSKREDHFDLPKVRGVETGTVEAGAVAGGTASERGVERKAPPAPTREPGDEEGGGEPPMSQAEMDAAVEREKAEAAGSKTPAKGQGGKPSLFGS